MLIRRTAGVVAAVVALALLLPGVASSLTYSRDGNGNIALPTSSSCPTISTPPAYEAIYNIDELEDRGLWDPVDHRPWDFFKKVSQIICGAEQGSEIRIGMFFIRAIGTATATGWGTRPESDPELVYDALEWVKAKRNVSVGLVLDGGDIMPAGAKEQVTERLDAMADIYYCSNGCLNTNKSSTFPYAINHEKFLTISDTVWANDASGTHPAVLSMSGNFARSQLRNYHQEMTLVYDDQKLFDLTDARYDDMAYCARTKCATDSGFSDDFQLSKERGIWIDPIYRHYTDAGRGTAVSFTPQAADVRDFYVQQFDDVDCTVDNKIRIAMFKLTDSKAEQMVDALVRLKNRGCDIEMLLTYQGGTTTISPAVVKALKNAKISAKCTAVAMHTKLILIGPQTTNQGRVLVGTQNMSVSGLRYNEEHVLTFDTRRATGGYVEQVRRLYGEYMTGWSELSLSTRSC